MHECIYTGLKWSLGRDDRVDCTVDYGMLTLYDAWVFYEHNNVSVFSGCALSNNASKKSVALKL